MSIARAAVLAAGLFWVAEASAQTTAASQIREHMEVKGSDGGHVGTVDKIEGTMMTLTRDDPAAGGVHHDLPVEYVASVSGGAVLLRMSAADAKRTWTVSPRPTGDRSR